MPELFDKAVREGAKVYTITKGPNKGRLIAIPKDGGHAILGGMRGHRKKEGEKQ
jgi:hypothetical protein